MTKDKNIFGPRSSAIPKLRPTLQQVTDFLDDTPKQAGGARHATDVIRYLKLLHRIEKYEIRKQAACDGQDARERMLLEALSRSGYMNEALLLAVGEYKYHLHTLAALDFARPEEFIRTAEAKRRKLSKTRIIDVERMIRLDERVAERKKILKGLGERWKGRAEELRGIARYVKDNLARVELMCRRCIGVIVEHEMGRSVERQLIEDIKGRFREQLKSELGRRKVTRTEAEKAREEADAIAAGLKRTITVDLFRMAGTFEAIHDHVNRIGGELAVPLDELLAGTLAMNQGTFALFRRIERALVALVADYPAQLDPEMARAGAAAPALVEEQRQIMLDRLFADLQRERRARKDRRELKDRRKAQDPNYSGPERRSGRNRRKRRNEGDRRVSGMALFSG
jgi:hypothetical protein